MGLSREDIQKQLNSRYAQEDPKMIREISYNLALAGTVESNLEERAANALKRLKSAASPVEPIQKAAKTTAHNKLSVCPICKTGMKTVKIMEDRDVYYCTDHRVTVPYPSDDAEADV